jgi:hypothetical protein
MPLSSDAAGFGQKDWNNQCGDICGMPGGVGLCCCACGPSCAPRQGGRPRRTWCSPLSPAASPPTHARLARPPSAPHPHRAPPPRGRADVLVCPLCAAGDTALAANEDCCCACCIAPSLCIFPCYWAHVRQAQARKYSITDPLSTGALGALLPCLMFTFGCRALAAGGAGCGEAAPLPLQARGTQLTLARPSLPLLSSPPPPLPQTSA